MQSKRIEGETMTIFKEKSVRDVLLAFMFIALIVLGSILTNFNIVDALYLACIFVFIIRFLLIRGK